MNSPRTEQLLQLARKAGVVRAREVKEQGIHPEYLRRLCQQGRLMRIGRGLYRLPDADITQHHALAQACKRVPKGVICLLSALRFHDLTTQMPREVWMAINRTMRDPRDGYPPLRIVRFSGKALTEGIEEHSIEGVTARIYRPAKTIADCFKHRNEIGLDVALEALREGWRERRFTMDEIWRYAETCRVANVMRPYLEALT